MSKLIVVDSAVTNASAPRIVRTPGVGGYSSRFIANHLDVPDGATLSTWASSAGTAPITLGLVGGTASITAGTENGIRHVYSPGGATAGARLLGPHTTQRPLTIAAVFKASPNVSQIVGMTGTAMARNAAGNYQGVSSSAAITSVSHDGWVFMLIAQSADANNSFIVRADSAEVTGATGTVAAPTFGGFYFGPTTAGQPAYLREMIAWPTQLNLADRDKVHAYMRSRYPELV